MYASLSQKTHTFFMFKCLFKCKVLGTTFRIVKDTVTNYFFVEEYFPSRRLWKIHQTSKSYNYNQVVDWLSVVILTNLFRAAYASTNIKLF